jgi:hypothetical protein
MHDRTIRDESLTSSFEAPRTSPDIPPKLLLDWYLIMIAITTDMPRAARLQYNPNKNIIVRVINVASRNFLLFFIARVNGELNPSHADDPQYACKTIVYLASTSATTMLVNSRIE